MTTARQIVNTALRRLEILAFDEEPDANMGDNALTALNQMMLGWEARGVNVEHTALSMNDDIALDEKWHMALGYLLAEHIGSEWGRSMRPEDKQEAMRWWNNLAAAYLVVPTVTLDRSLTVLPSQEDQYSFGQGST